MKMNFTSNVKDSSSRQLTLNPTISISENFTYMEHECPLYSQAIVLICSFTINDFAMRLLNDHFVYKLHK